MRKVNAHIAMVAKRHGLQNEVTYLYEVVDWLREDKGIHIQIENDKDGWNYFVTKIPNKDIYSVYLSGETKTYDYALKKAITQTLEYMCNPDHNGECLLCDSWLSQCDLETS